MVEAPFGVKLDRKHQNGQSRYGQAVSWIDYSLPRNEENAEGIKKMCEHLTKQGAVEKAGHLTDKERLGVLKEIKRDVEQWLDERDRKTTSPTYIQPTLL